jgi:glycosyltransferase involved in cell wall biosynthesis
MKILHVDINGWVYGVQKYVINFCKELNKRDGYRSIVVGASGIYLKILKTENIEVIPLRGEWGKIDLDPKGWIRLFGIIEKVRPNIIHSHGTKEHIISKIIGRLLGIPSIPIYHCIHKISGSVNPRLGLKRRIYQTLYLDFLERFTSHFAYKNIAVSNSVKNNITRFGIPGEKIEVIYSGVELDDSLLRKEKVDGANGRIKILSVGRIDKNKGIADIIRVGKILKERGYDFEITFVGDGPLLGESRRLVERYRLKQQIKFSGYLEDIKQVLSSSDIFVSASYSEGLPLNIIEAMAYGLPVVVTNAGGVTEIVDDKVNGLVVKKGSPQQLKEALLLMLKNYKLRREYGRKGREKVLREFGIDRMIAQYISLYDTILKRTVS